MADKELQALREIRLDFSFINSDNLGALKYLEGAFHRSIIELNRKHKENTKVTDKRIFKFFGKKEEHIKFKNELVEKNYAGDRLLMDACKAISSEIFKLRKRLEIYHRCKLNLAPLQPVNEVTLKKVEKCDNHEDFDFIIGEEEENIKLLNPDIKPNPDFHNDIWKNSR